MVYEYRRNSATLKDLPENSRALSVLLKQNNTFKNHVFNGDEAKALKSLQVNSSVFQITQDDAVFTNQLSASMIIGTKKYPSVKNIKVLINRLGIKNILKETH